MIWLFLFIATILLIYLKIYKPNQYWKSRGLKYLEPWPIVGNMLPYSLGRVSFFSLVKTFYDDCKARYCGIYQFTQPILLVKDIELIKSITSKDFEHFIDHDSFFSASNEPIFSENLFSSRGQKWRDLRSLLSPTFTGSKMRSMFILIQDCAKRFTSHFEEKLVSNKNKPIEIELKNTFKRYTIDVIGTCAYGVEIDSMKNQHNDFYEMGKNVGDFTGWNSLKLIGYMTCAKLMRFFKVRLISEEQVNFFSNIISTSIDYRQKNNIQRPDLIHLMMEARKGKLKFEESAKIDDAGFATVAESEVGKKNNKLDVTDDVIVAQAIIFFVGGTDTTSTVLAFAVHELAVNEDVQRKLQTEIDETIQKNNGEITYEVIAKLKYLDMVVSETLRLWPQGYFIDRLCVKDYKIDQVQPDEEPFVVKKGEIVWFSVVGIHRDPQFYPNPDKFDPERFSDENKHKIKPGTYMPFGFGPRSCIGNRFALLTVKTFLFYFLSKFDIVCVNKTQVPMQINKSQILLNASNGFWAGFKLRS